jgi:hypothetical protein
MVAAGGCWTPLEPLKSVKPLRNNPVVITPAEAMT